jgi:hypothetical protein
MSAGLIVDEASEDRLVEELDRRLVAQGLGGGRIRRLVELIREGWEIIAVPGDLADRYGGGTADGHTIASLASELRRRIVEAQESTAGDAVVVEEAPDRPVVTKTGRAWDHASGTAGWWAVGTDAAGNRLAAVGRGHTRTAAEGDFHRKLGAP